MTRGSVLSVNPSPRLDTILGAEPRSPTSAVLPRSGRSVLVKTLLRRDKRHADIVPRALTCWAPNKPSLDFRGDPTFPEFVLVRLLEEAGWNARWIKNWTGSREFCADVDKPSAISAAAEAIFAAIHERAAALRGAGSWDVFAWRDGEYVFIESKQHRSSDRLNDNQRAWLEAALEIGISEEAFTIVEYDAGPSTRPRIPAVRERIDRVAVRPPRIATAAQPTAAQVRQARDGVSSRGWARSKAAHHGHYPIGIREDNGSWKPCEHCHAHANPARWPLFFRTGAHSGELLWACSTCKVSQADERAVAEVLVQSPQA
jgi:hypothetical protein